MYSFILISEFRCDNTVYNPERVYGDHRSLPIRIEATKEASIDGTLRGTVSSSIITIDYSGRVQFTEFTWNGESNGLLSKNTLAFTME